jgi:hypothetical protein
MHNPRNANTRSDNMATRINSSMANDTDEMCNDDGTEVYEQEDAVRWFILDMHGNIRSIGEHQGLEAACEHCEKERISFAWLCREDVARNWAAQLSAELGTPLQQQEYLNHEALDRTSVIQGLVENSLLDHPSISMNAEWRKLAEDASDALHKLYQRIDGVHPGDKP